VSICLRNVTITKFSVWINKPHLQNSRMPSAALLASITPTGVKKRMQRICSKKSKKHMQFFPMTKSEHSTTASGTMALVVHRSVDSEEVASISISKTFLEGIFSPIYSVEGVEALGVLVVEVQTFE
jgi:hypothetical protein